MSRFAVIIFRFVWVDRRYLRWGGLVVVFCGILYKCDVFDFIVVCLGVVIGGGGGGRGRGFVLGERFGF